jgi:hypothetical protein
MSNLIVDFIQARRIDSFHKLHFLLFLLRFKVVSLPISQPDLSTLGDDRRLSKYIRFYTSGC